MLNPTEDRFETRWGGEESHLNLAPLPGNLLPPYREALWKGEHLHFISMVF